jgi:WD40 repeat protein
MSIPLCRIIIAAPNDVYHECQIAVSLIEDLQTQLAESLDLQIEFNYLQPASEEKPACLPRPSHRDVFIMILGSRLGLPVPLNSIFDDGIPLQRADGSTYESVTVAAFEEAILAAETVGQPRVFSFIKGVPLDPSLGELAWQQHAAVKNFHKKWFIDEQGQSIRNFYPFNTLSEFARILARRLHEVVNSHFLAEPLPMAWQNWPGINALTPVQAPLLLEREVEVHEIFSTLRSRLLRTQVPSFLLVLGLTGSGKSSLLNAGLLPLLKLLKIPYQTFSPFTASTDVLAGLTAQVAKLVQNPPFSLIQPLQPDGQCTLFANGLFCGILVIDQLEQIFTLPLATVTRQEILRYIFALAHGGVVGVVVTLRSEFWPHCHAFPELRELMTGEGNYLLLPPTQNQLQTIVTQWLESRSPTANTQLARQLQTDSLNLSQSLTLLQFTFTQLNEQLEVNNWLETYQAFGGLNGILAHHAEAFFAQLTVDEQQAWRQMIRLLISVDIADTVAAFIPAKSGSSSLAFITRPISHAQLATDELRQNLIEKLLAANLLLKYDSAQPVVYVIPEIWLVYWARLQDWLREERNSLYVRSHLAQAAIEWDSQQQAPEFLLTEGFLLAEAENVLWQWEETLAPHEKAFLEASITQRQQENEAQAASYLLRERQQQRKNTRLSVLLLMILIITGWLTWEWWFTEERIAEHQQQRRIALARQLDAQATASHWQAQAEKPGDLLNDEYGYFNHALLLAVQAMRFHHGGESQAHLLQVLQSHLSLESYWYWPDTAVEQIAFSPDGKRLASAHTDNSIRLWQIDTKQPLGKPLSGHSKTITALAFNPFGTQLVTASADQTVQLWDLETQTPLGDPLQHQTVIQTVNFSPDGTLLACGGADHQIRIWQLADHQLRSPLLQGHNDKITALAFAPDGKRLASGSADKTVRVWELKTQKGKMPASISLQAHTEAIQALTFNPFGTRLVTAGADNTIMIWELDQTEPLGHRLSGHTAPVQNLAFSPDGKRLASASADKTVRIWEVEPPQAIAAPLFGHSAGVHWLAFKADNKRLYSIDTHNTLITWNLAQTSRLRNPLFGPSQSTINITQLTFSPNGQQMALATGDSTIILWDLAKNKRLGVLSGHQKEVSSVAYSPNGKRLVSGSRDTLVRLWDVTRQKPIGQPLAGHTDIVNSVAFSPNGQLVASASDDHSIRIWAVDTGQLLGQPLIGHSGAVQSIAFSPNGQQLVSGGWDDKVLLWSVSNQTPIGEPFAGHQDAVYSVAFSPNGKYIASASRDQTIRLWQVQGNPKALGQPLMGHQKDVTSLAFSPNGRWLASGSWDNSIKLWHLNFSTQTWLPIGTLQGHTSFISDLAYSPDGRWLASASLDKTVMLWDVDTKNWLKQACQIAGRNFTPAEWQYYLKDEPYQATCPGY